VRRFFLDLAASTPTPRVGEVVTLGAEESHHLTHVLRADAGREVELTDGRGHVLQGQVVARDAGVARLRITGVTARAQELAPPLLNLACAVVKGKRYEFALEKAVELGAHRIVPLRCEHGVVDPRAGKKERWQTLLVAALKQSQRCWLPALTEAAGLGATLGIADGPCYFGAAPGDVPGQPVQTGVALAIDAANRCAAGTAAPASLTFFIGPEGGWTTAELALLVRAGAVPVTLGPHLLRAETAACAGLVVLQAIRQAWQGARALP
jgi:16S rRNA (uracil1498-N3)-methyltransferase